MTEVTLVERRGGIGCAAHALQLGTLGGGRRLLAAESLPAADGLPLRLWVALVPVTVGVDSVALAGSMELLAEIDDFLGSSWYGCFGELRGASIGGSKARIIVLRGGRMNKKKLKVTHVL